VKIRKEESGSLLKKSGSLPRTQKLFECRPWSCGAGDALEPNYKSFFGSFCSQKELLP
jgi:hypothetical protein